MTTPLPRLLILSDGRAGHVSTSRGMAALLAQVWPCSVEVMELRLRAKFLRPLLKFMLNSGLTCRLDRHPATRGWPALFYRGYRDTPAPVVMSAGGDTLYMNAHYGRCRGSANVFCGSLRGVRADLFDLIVHIRPADLPNWMAMEVLPSAASAVDAERAGAAFADTHLESRRTGYWTLLIGGNGSGYRFRGDEILAAVEQCAHLARQHDKRLLISTSRRTGSGVETKIRDWLARQQPNPAAYTVLFNHKPERVAAAFMALGEVVFCTEDSLSMLSEAVLLKRPLVSLRPDHAHPTRDHQGLVENLAVRRRLIRCPLDRLAHLDVAEWLESWQSYVPNDQATLQQRMLDMMRRKTHPVRPTQ